MRFVVLMLLAMASMSATAEWEAVGGNPEVGVSTYADRATIRRSGYIVRMWVMYDFKAAQGSSTGKRYLSSKAQNEYDCKDEKSRTLFFTWYSENMGNGKIVYSDDGIPSNWRPITPSSVGESFWKLACGNTSPGPAAPMTNPDFDLVNRAAQNILNIYVSPIDANNWGEDRLPGILRVGERITIRLPRDGRCRFDIRVIYSDLSIEERRAQNLCAIIDLAFDGSARRNAPSAKTPVSPPSNSPAAQGQSYGTGFFISPLGHALTNNHVTENCRSIVALLEGGAHPAQLIRRDERNDLALIRVQSTGAVPFVSFRAPPAIKAGEGVVVAGFPLSNILQNGLNITIGNVSALAGLGGNTAFLQITAPVQQGNSGGPLLDMAGNLVGVVVSKLDAARVAQVTGDIPQNINFAVQGAIARLFVEASGQRLYERPSDNELPVGDVSDRARAFTFQIECRK